MPQPNSAPTQVTPPTASEANAPDVATGTAAASDAHPHLLELRHVSRYFQVRQGLLGKARRLWAVADVSLDLNPGETLGLVGESGCGKSTLAKIAAGLLPPSSGEVQLDGAPLYDASNASRLGRPSVHMVFQDPFSSLNPRLTIGRSISEPLDIEGALNPAQRKERVMEMLQLVGLLPEHASRYPHEFSGGQRQRAVVARALINRPKLVICDEPVSSLDASVQAQVLNLLKSLQEMFSPAYLFISHDLSVVGHMSDRIAVMYLGRIVELSTAQSLFDAPLHPYTQALLAAIPGAGVSADMGADGSASTGGRDTPAHANLAHANLVRGDPASPLNPPPGCAFHPRCPKVMPCCRTQRPDLLSVDGRLTACWLYANPK